VLYVAAVAQALLVPFFALAARPHHSRSSAARIPSQRPVPYPHLALPLTINGSQYVPLAWADIPGWGEDDQLAAFRTFRASCRPIAAQHDLPSDPKALGISLRDPCRAARATEISDGAKARRFFEEHFTPLKISRLGEGDGTGLALANQEATTPIWFALRLGPTTFGVFDAFANESGRQAHLNGR